MQVIRFMILSVIWLADMAWMVAIAPIGEHPLLFSVLFGLGHLLMIFLVRLFPKNFAPPKAFTVIFIIGILGRFVFLSYPVGNDIFRYVWEGLFRLRVLIRLPTRPTTRFWRTSPGDNFHQSGGRSIIPGYRRLIRPLACCFSGCWQASPRTPYGLKPL